MGNQGFDKKLVALDHDGREKLDSTCDRVADAIQNQGLVPQIEDKIRSALSTIGQQKFLVSLFKLQKVSIRLMKKFEPREVEYSLSELKQYKKDKKQHLESLMNRN